MKRKTIKIKKKVIYYYFLLAILVIASYFVYPQFQKSLELPIATSANYDLKEAMTKEKIILKIDEGKYPYIQGIETNVYSYNNQIPGPLIKGKVGETKKVIIYNKLEEPTTVHWHGLQLANVEDGVPQVTQDSIMPGESFEYEIEFRNPGLYWYHSHVEAHKQVESGLQGIILIEPTDSTSEGNILVLDDVLLGNNYQLRSFDLGVMHGRFGNVFLVNGEQNPIINIKDDRLRIVNTANARSFNLMIGGKSFKVIGMDIGPSQTFETSMLTIHPGERYDVILPSDLTGSITLSHYTRRGQTPLATLNYNGEIIDETKLDKFIMPFNLEEIIEKEPDYHANLEGYRGGEYGLIWSINRKYFPDTTEIFKVAEGDVVKFRIKNTQGQPHPMHLHGQKFIVLSRNGILEKNFGWKDIVMVSSNEEVDIVFVGEDKGKWVFHCHILEHAKAGMLSVVEVV